MSVPAIDHGDVTIYQGDALEQLANLETGSAQCIVTSPPFWGLRDYGTGTWLGGDPDCTHDRSYTPGGTARSTLGGYGNGLTQATIERKVEAYGQVAFTGDCPRCGAERVDQQIGLEATPEQWCSALVDVMREARRVLAPDGVAWVEVGDTYADRASTAEKGAKVNALTNGRKAKDLVGAPWLLAFALRADGWYLRSDTIWHRPNPMPESVTDRPTKAHSYVFLLSASDRYYYDADAIREPQTTTPSDTVSGGYSIGSGRNDGSPHMSGGFVNGNAAAGRNARSVWTITPEGTPFEHYATMPTVLASRCIRTGSRAGDLVLDPFMGAGTTALVARALGRRAAGVELSPAYLDIARDRLAQLGLLT